MTLGRAIERAMKSSRVGKQTVLADLLGVDQTSVSKMIRGKTAVTVERVAEIESLCELPPGRILVWAGYVSPAAYVTEPENEEQMGQVIDMMTELERAVANAKAARELLNDASYLEGIRGAGMAASSGSGEPVSTSKRRTRPRPPVPEGG